MASGNNVRERLARLEAEHAQARKEIELLWQVKRTVDKLQQHARAVLFVVIAVGLQAVSGPLVSVFTGVLRSLLR